MTSFLSRLHSDLRSIRFTHRGATHAPGEVPTGLHKTYPRMEQISLPDPLAITMTLPQALEKRASSRIPGGESPLSLSDISTLLGHSLSKRKNTERRNYPSGGGLYPVETYLISTLVEGTQPGVFHYNPTEHALERLWDLPEDFDLKTLVPYPPFLVPSALLIFTSVWKRSSAKYGDFTYGLALLEAGHMSENVLLVAGAIGLETRPMAGFEDEKIIELLDINPENEQPIHSITISKSAGAV